MVIITIIIIFFIIIVVVTAYYRQYCVVKSTIYRQIRENWLILFNIAYYNIQSLKHLQKFQNFRETITVRFTVLIAVTAMLWKYGGKRFRNVKYFRVKYRTSGSFESVDYDPTMESLHRVNPPSFEYSKLTQLSTTMP